MYIHNKIRKVSSKTLSLYAISIMRQYQKLKAYVQYVCQNDLIVWYDDAMCNSQVLICSQMRIKPVDFGDALCEYDLKIF